MIDRIMDRKFDNFIALKGTELMEMIQSNCVREALKLIWCEAYMSGYHKKEKEEAKER